MFSREITQGVFTTGLAVLLACLVGCSNSGSRVRSSGLAPVSCSKPDPCACNSLFAEPESVWLTIGAGEFLSDSPIAMYSGAKLYWGGEYLIDGQGYKQLNQPLEARIYSSTTKSNGVRVGPNMHFDESPLVELNYGNKSGMIADHQVDAYLQDVSTLLITGIEEADHLALGETTVSFAAALLEMEYTITNAVNIDRDVLWTTVVQVLIIDFTDEEGQRSDNRLCILHQYSNTSALIIPQEQSDAILDVCNEVYQKYE